MLAGLLPLCTTCMAGNYDAISLQCMPPLCTCITLRHQAVQPVLHKSGISMCGASTHAQLVFTAKDPLVAGCCAVAAICRNRCASVLQFVAAFSLTATTLTLSYGFGWMAYDVLQGLLMVGSYVLCQGLHVAVLVQHFFGVGWTYLCKHARYASTASAGVTDMGTGCLNM